MFLKVTFARNLAKKLNSSFYYFNLLFQLSVVNPENLKEINAWEVLKFLKTKPEFRVTLAKSLWQPLNFDVNMIFRSAIFL